MPPTTSDMQPPLVSPVKPLLLDLGPPLVQRQLCSTSLAKLASSSLEITRPRSSLTPAKNFTTPRSPADVMPRPRQPLQHLSKTSSPPRAPPLQPGISLGVRTPGSIVLKIHKVSASYPSPQPPPAAALPPQLSSQSSAVTRACVTPRPSGPYMSPVLPLRAAAKSRATQPRAAPKPRVAPPPPGSYMSPVSLLRQSTNRQAPSRAASKSQATPSPLPPPTPPVISLPPSLPLPLKPVGIIAQRSLRGPKHTLLLSEQPTKLAEVDMAPPPLCTLPLPPRSMSPPTQSPPPVLRENSAASSPLLPPAPSSTF